MYSATAIVVPDGLRDLFNVRAWWSADLGNSGSTVSADEIPSGRRHLGKPVFSTKAVKTVQGSRHPAVNNGRRTCTRSTAIASRPMFNAIFSPGSASKTDCDAITRCLFSTDSNYESNFFSTTLGQSVFTMRSSNCRYFVYVFAQAHTISEGCKKF